jgi:hypothetical protein
MKIGIVGNRTGWTYEEVKKQLDTLGVYKTDMLISHNISLESKQKYLDKFSSLEKTLSDIEERYK